MKIISPHLDFCILIPCYNNIPGLISSLKSICYTPEKFSILIVDDGSIFPVDQAVVETQIGKKYPLHIIRLANNSGITHALNTGLEYIYNHLKVDFIARLDCGDICTKDRFYKQVQYLQSNPGISLIGSWCFFKDYLTGAAYRYTTPTFHPAIKRSMFFRNVFIHPSVMWRFSSFKIKYPEQYPFAEDYGLFFEMLTNGRTAILNEFLVTCEINAKGISIANRTAQLKSRLKVIRDYGRASFLYFLGGVKLRILLLIPHRILFMAKHFMYKAA